MWFAASRLYCIKLTSHPQIKGGRNKSQTCSFWSSGSIVNHFALHREFRGLTPVCFVRTTCLRAVFGVFATKQEMWLVPVYLLCLRTHGASCSSMQRDVRVFAFKHGERAADCACCCALDKCGAVSVENPLLCIWEWAKTVNQVAVWRCPVVKVLARTRYRSECCWGFAQWKCLLWGAKERVEKQRRGNFDALRAAKLWNELLHTADLWLWQRTIYTDPPHSPRIGECGGSIEMKFVRF